MPKVERFSNKSHRDWLRSVLRVGDGRGFVIEPKDRWQKRLVVTAAHCLTAPIGVRAESTDWPQLPPAHGMSYTEERLYPRLLGPLGRKPKVAAECLFVDPVADLAVLCSPDSQELSEEADAYDALVEAAVPLAIGTLSFTIPRHSLPDGTEFPGQAEAESEAWLLALNGHWFRCRVKSIEGRSLHISDAAEDIRGGMSGSPIVAPDGRAIGIVCISGGLDGNREDAHREGGPNPFLPANLPGWLAGDLLKMPELPAT
jgi:Trypsin-like peptidase domain